MANLPATLWALPTPQGAKDGTSLADAAGLNAGAADDIYAIINAGTVVEPVEVKGCADAPVTVTATAEVTKDSTGDWPIRMVGRNAADTADAQLVLDADDGAFPVFTLTTADYWWWYRITSQNTDENAGNDGWAVGANADYNTWIDCKTDHCRQGWGSAGAYETLFRCCATNHNTNGFLGGITSVCEGCITDTCGSVGFDSIGTVVRCASSNNGNVGFSAPKRAIGSVAYNNTGAGFYRYPNMGNLWIDCIATDGSDWGFDCTDGFTQLVNCAHYNNTSGGITGAGKYLAENIIALTADPFVDAANGDFRLNNVPGGGALLRGVGHASPDGNFTGYEDVGAAQHRDRVVVAFG